MCQKSYILVDALICYKQKCKVASFNLAHPVFYRMYLLHFYSKCCFIIFYSRPTRDDIMTECMLRIRLFASSDCHKLLLVTYNCTDNFIRKNSYLNTAD